MNFRIEGRAKPHPKYNDANYENDIAIVKLDKEINFKDFSGTVTPVCLARYNGRYQSRTRTSKQCEFYRVSQKKALSEPRLLPVLLSPQLGKQLISWAGDELLP